MIENCPIVEKQENIDVCLTKKKNKIIWVLYFKYDLVEIMVMLEKLRYYEHEYICRNNIM